MRSSFHTLAAWLVLVAYLVSGIASGRGLVVCLEADGSATLELASSGCAGCPGSAQDASGADSRSNELASCPCLDVPVPFGNGELRTQSRSGERVGFPACAELPASWSALALDPHSHALRLERSSAHPRPPPCLAHVRTVVLRV